MYVCIPSGLFVGIVWCDIVVRIKRVVRHAEECSNEIHCLTAALIKITRARISHVTRAEDGAIKAGCNVSRDQPNEPILRYCVYIVQLPGAMMILYTRGLCNPASGKRLWSTCMPVGG